MYPCTCCDGAYLPANCENVPDWEATVAQLYNVDCHYNHSSGVDAVYSFQLHVTTPSLTAPEAVVCGGQLCKLHDAIVDCSVEFSDEFVERAHSAYVQFWNSTTEEWCSEQTELVSLLRITPEPTSWPTHAPIDSRDKKGGFSGWLERQDDAVLLLGGILLFIMLCFLLLFLRAMCCRRRKGGSRTQDTTV